MSIWSRNRALFGVLVPAGLLVTLLIIQSVGRKSDPCVDEVLEEIKSPAGHYKAVVAGRICDGVEGFSTKVSLHSQRSGEPSALGNVLLIDTNPGKSTAPSGVGGGPTVNVSWVSENELRLTYHPDVKVWKASRSAGQVAIEHVRRWQ